MVNTFTTRKLTFGGANVLEELGALNQALILRYIEKYSPASTMLRQNEGPTCGPNMFNKRSSVRPKFRKRPDIFAESNRWHAPSL
jgi:hypothetical protein